jgi:hypothetical protein
MRGFVSTRFILLDFMPIDYLILILKLRNEYCCKSAGELLMSGNIKIKKLQSFLLSESRIYWALGNFLFLRTSFPSLQLDQLDHFVPRGLLCLIIGVWYGEHEVICYMLFEVRVWLLKKNYWSLVA